MSGFHNWYVENQDEITWFLIGWLCFACIDSLASGRYFWAAFNAGLAYFNYKMYNVRLR